MFALSFLAGAALGATALRKRKCRRELSLDTQARYQRALVTELSGRNDLPPEDHGDPFDRQRCIDWFKHGEIRRKSVLVLGVGGVGCAVALTLCRMGVRQVYVLDCDVVDTTNLNRQALYSARHVGQPKAVAAAAVLERDHAVGGTRVEALQVDAVRSWGQVVACARRCDAVFNCIDRGALFDLAVCVLCRRLGVPYLSASTFSAMAQLDAFPCTRGEPCWRCSQAPSDSLKCPAPVAAAWLERHRLAHPPARGAAGAGLLSSAEVPCFLADVFDARFPGDVLAAALAAARAAHPVEAATAAPAAAGGDQGVPGEDPSISIDATLSEVLPRLRDYVQRRLCAGDEVLDAAALPFVPKDLGMPTRAVGSWACAAVAGGVLLVNAWVQRFCEAKFPHWTTVNLVDPTSTMAFDVAPESGCPVCALDLQLPVPQVV